MAVGAASPSLLPCSAEHAPLPTEVLNISHHGHSHGGAGNESAKEMLAGGIAGLSEHFVTFPFDTIKTRMQEGGGAHRSFWSTFLGIVKNEPVRHLYRGCAPVLACSFPAHAAYFSLYEPTKRLIGADSSAGYAIASVAATVGHDSVSVPFDVVKQHMQMDGHRHHNSSLACLRCIVRDHGAFAIVKSLPITVVMNIPHMATHWVVYERMKVVLGLGNTEAFEPRYVVAGLVSGAAAASVSTPLDVVKTQLQLMKSPTFVAAARDVYACAGFMGFTRGLLPRVCSLSPSAAVVMSSYEAMKVLLSATPIT